MATFSGVDVAGLIKGGASVQMITDALIGLNRSLTWQMENLDSENVREIGGWYVGPTELRSRNFDVGMSTGIGQFENVRFWAGSSDMNNAPFRVYDSGKMVATGAEISGKVTMATGSYISWPDVNSDPVATGAASTANSAVSIANSIAAGEYTGGSFISGRLIFSPNIFGGQITSNTTINVGTDLTVGNNIQIGDRFDYTFKQIQFNSTAKISSEDWNLFLSADNIGFVGVSAIDFGNAVITGKGFTAKFG